MLEGFGGLRVDLLLGGLEAALDVASTFRVIHVRFSLEGKRLLDRDELREGLAPLPSQRLGVPARHAGLIIPLESLLVHLIGHVSSELDQLARLGVKERISNDHLLIE